MKTAPAAHFEGRLALRQTLIAAAVGLLLGVGFSALQVSRDFTESEAGERREIDQLLAVVHEPAAQAGYQLSEAAANVVVQGTLSAASVHEAVLTNDFGEVLASGRSASQPAAAADAWWARFVAPTHEYRLPLVHGPSGKRVGELRVVTTRGPRVERLMRGAWRELGLSVLRSLTVAMVLGVCFYLTLTRPLAAIARRIRQGPAQDGGPAVAGVARDDEIGEIAAAFERYEREARERTSSIEAAASALAASELRHRRIVETAGEGVWQVDAHGTTTLANEAMAEMLGTSVALLQGRSMFDFMDDEGRREATALFLERHAGRHERRDFRFLRADGRALWAEVSSCPITDTEGRHAGALAMVTNATERRRRDDELRASNAQLRAMVEGLELHKLDMAHIAELNELLQSARTEAEAYDVIQAVGARLFAGGSGGLSIATSGTEMLRRAEWGSPPWLPPRYEREGCWAIRRGGPHLQDPGHGVSCCHHPGDGLDMLLCTPLYVEGQLLGVLHLATHMGADHDLQEEAQHRRVEIFGQVIKLGLSNLRLRETLRDQAQRDALTGLPNRRLFDDMLPRELARCARSGQALTVAVVDIDHFKHFNDTYGHDMGDRVLRAVATALLRNIRSADLACRWGGDEFMCLMPGAAAEEAKARFVELLAHGSVGEDLGAGALPEPVTVTVGLASAPESGIEAAELLRAADAALYVAKSRGGHCVEVAGGKGAGAPLAATTAPA